LEQIFTFTGNFLEQRLGRQLRLAGFTATLCSILLISGSVSHNLRTADLRMVSAPEPAAKPVATWAFLAKDAVGGSRRLTPAETREVECVAKVVIHEAGNQSFRGKVAVAQVIRARIKDGRFPATPCAVTLQDGQFFDVDAYHPSKTDKSWQEAVSISVQTLGGGFDDVVPGALFFHRVGYPMRSYQRLSQVGDHVFYR